MLALFSVFFFFCKRTLGYQWLRLLPLGMVPWDLFLHSYRHLFSFHLVWALPPPPLSLALLVVENWYNPVFVLSS